MNNNKKDNWLYFLQSIEDWFMQNSLQEYVKDAPFSIQYYAEVLGSQK